jgi:excisionase family DNA binding protein
MTVDEVADRARLSPKTVRRAIRSGELAAYKLRGRLRIPTQEYLAWVRRAVYVPPIPESESITPVAPPCGSRASLRRIEGGSA